MATTPSLTIPDADAPVVLAALEWKYKGRAVGQLLNGDEAAYAALSVANKYRLLMRVFFKEIHKEYLTSHPAQELDVT